MLPSVLLEMGGGGQVAWCKHKQVFCWRCGGEGGCEEVVWCE